MARLTRVETQQLNRAKVVAAAREEFAERGYREAKIDAIADRAELTRGAVYSNFPGKRALYFAVLADLAAQPHPASAQPGRTASEALGALAACWVSRLTGDNGPRLGKDLLAEIRISERLRGPFGQLLGLNALLLSLALERLEPPERPEGAPPARLVRLAQTVLTTLHGASELSAAAPEFGEPFDVITACERLAGLRLSDFWPPPEVVPQVRADDQPWTNPEAFDLVRGQAGPLPGDGVLAVLGMHRLSAVEQAVRAGAEVTAVLVTSDPAELAPLARLSVTELAGCLRHAFPADAWPGLRVVCDDSGAIAAAAGVPSVSDGTEVAVRLEDGRIVGRADGVGACHAVAAGQVNPAQAGARKR